MCKTYNIEEKLMEFKEINSERERREQKDEKKKLKIRKNYQLETCRTSM